MPVLKLSTPGVYVQEIPAFPPSVAEVETAIPAFIGYTEKAVGSAGEDLTFIPKKITDISQYTLYFGGPPQETDASVAINVQVDASGNPTSVAITTPDPTKQSLYKLAYAVQHFFDNGGATCYVVSAGKYAGAAPVANDLAKALDQVRDIDEVTILAIPDAQASNDAATLIGKLIEQAATLKDRFAIIDPVKVTPKTAANPGGDIDNDVGAIRNATKGVAMDRYAAAYYPNLLTTYGRSFDFANLTIDESNDNNIKGKKLSDVPGGQGSAVWAKVKAAVAQTYVELPPSGAIAGLYARIDATKGVWKAPANEALFNVVAPTVAVSSREQESLNVDPNTGKSINVIRAFPGFGTLVWGARTLNGNDNEWRYISTRRFFNMVEESIKKACQAMVFEPNTIDTWVKVQAMIENYLTLKWKEGALAGAKAEQAFYVRVGLGTTMTGLDILEGRMNVEIGMAVSRPAEFIVLKFTQIMQQA